MIDPTERAFGEEEGEGGEREGETECELRRFEFALSTEAEEERLTSKPRMIGFYPSRPRKIPTEKVISSCFHTQKAEALSPSKR